MDRRPLALLLVVGLSGAVPAGAVAASPGELLAQSGGGTLSDQSSADLVAQAPEGTLSDTPTTTGSGSGSGGSKSSSGSRTTATATPAALPFTGSDPRVMLALGAAAILAGAGLRLRTGDARDF